MSFPACQPLFCSYCNSSPAVVFCHCSQDACFLCSAHISVHILYRDKATPHLISPIERYYDFHSPLVAEVLITGNTTKGELITAADAMDNIAKEIVKAANVLVSFINDQKQRTLALIQKEKANLEAEKPLAAINLESDSSSQRIVSFVIDLQSVKSIVDSMLSYSMGDSSAFSREWREAREKNVYACFRAERIVPGKTNE